MATVHRCTGTSLKQRIRRGGRDVLDTLWAPIDASNKRYLQFLDALSLMDSAPIDAKDPYAILSDTAQQSELAFDRLLAYARKYYNSRVIQEIVQVADRRGLLT